MTTTSRLFFRLGEGFHGLSAHRPAQGQAEGQSPEAAQDRSPRIVIADHPDDAALGVMTVHAPPAHALTLARKRLEEDGELDRFRSVELLHLDKGAGGEAVFVYEVAPRDRRAAYKAFAHEGDPPGAVHPSVGLLLGLADILGEGDAPRVVVLAMPESLLLCCAERENGRLTPRIVSRIKPAAFDPESFAEALAATGREIDPFPGKSGLKRIDWVDGLRPSAAQIPAELAGLPVHVHPFAHAVLDGATFVSGLPALIDRVPLRFVLTDRAERLGLWLERKEKALALLLLLIGLLAWGGYILDAQRIRKAHAQREELTKTLSALAESRSNNRGEFGLALPDELSAALAASVDLGQILTTVSAARSDALTLQRFDLKTRSGRPEARAQLRSELRLEGTIDGDYPAASAELIRFSSALAKAGFTPRASDIVQKAAEPGEGGVAKVRFVLELAPPTPSTAQAATAKPALDQSGPPQSGPSQTP